MLLHIQKTRRSELLLIKYLYKVNKINLIYFKGSALTQVFKILWEATKRRKNSRFSRISCLDNAKLKHGGSYTEEEVNEVKSISGFIPVFASTIIYWTIYNQV